MANREARKAKPYKPAETGSTSIILESISDGVFTVDDDWRITSFNRAAEEITGISRREAIGRKCSEIFRANMCESSCALRHTLSSGDPIINKAAFIIDSRNRRVPISVSTAILRDESGKILGGAETFRDLRLVEELRDELKRSFRAGDLVSRSPSMRKTIDLAHMLADSRSTVLIQGDTGTGKEVVARTIHQLGNRKNHPFIAVACGALPDTLLESELFGYKAGAFTGATKDKPGRFELAEGGTLFLDEIGEISPELQVKLLRVLQDKTFEKLGDTKSTQVDTRIIAATNRDLAAIVEEGLFRQDLFYRINIVKIELPPLKQRKVDIPYLVDRFVSRFNLMQRKSITGVSPEAMDLLMSHDYPGNIRELENIVEHAFVMCSNGLLEPQHLPRDFTTNFPAVQDRHGINETVRAVEAQTILNVLKRNRYDRQATAKELGVHKSTLFRKIKALGIPLPEKDGRSRIPT
ncbi:MAG: PAS domain-containing protein [Proteobacteria bacterium]|nr:PAS domain-containing protein [Pseudomonadota bacterium]